MPSAHLPKILKRLIHTALILAVSLFTYHCALSTTLAGSGLVTSIGGATFIQGASQFWVTSTTPTFSGITSAGAKVSGTVGTQTVSATADSSGNWSWTPTTALSGAVPVSITAGTITVAFTLNIGSVPASIASASGATLQPAGTQAPTLTILIFGVLLTSLGFWGLRKSLAKANQ